MNTIPGLEYPRTDLPDNVHFIGLLPSEVGAGAQLPAWFDSLPSSRPIVHVTQGTIANARPDLFAPAVAVLAREDVSLVISTGGRPPLALGLDNPPANVKVATFIDYRALLPRTSAFLTNGGFGGVQQALRHGIPVAVAGDTEEKPEVAARVRFSGAGLALRSGKPPAREVRLVVERLLTEPALRGRAQALAAEYARCDALAWRWRTCALRSDSA